MRAFTAKWKLVNSAALRWSTWVSKTISYLIVPLDLVTRDDVRNYPTDFAPMSAKDLELLTKKRRATHSDHRGSLRTLPVIERHDLRSGA